MIIKGIIFDMDGVVTQTAIIHFKAWKIIIDEFLDRLNSPNSLPFTENDYLYYLDGMPRKDGVANFLKSRNISLAEISGRYKSLEEYIGEICENKNRLILDVLAEEKIYCYQDTIDFISFVSSLNYSVAIISSSKNCKAILKNANIEHLFPIRVDGETAEEYGLAGKPEPAIFLEAAKQLNLLPQECMVIEDALAGVIAAKKGEFGLVVALDREKKLHEEFKRIEADYIINDLSPRQIELYQGLIMSQKRAFGSAYNALPIILDLLKNKNEIVVFLDYDGTLTPIVDKPEHAHLSLSMRNCISRLSKNYLTVIVSGRELSDLKKQVNVPGIFYVGNHGLEFEGLEHTQICSQIGEEFRQQLDLIYQELCIVLEGIKGCIIENKKLTLSIHYRLVVEDKQEYISNIIDEILVNYPQFGRHYGKKVFEIRPAVECNKGIAASDFLKRNKENNPSLVPIYIGDDVTDEDAFKQFSFNGITIKVTHEVTETHAHYFLKSPAAVEDFLNNINDYKDINYESMDYQSVEF